MAIEQAREAETPARHRRRGLVHALGVGVALLVAPVPAEAEPKVQSYALIVGSNHGGVGQSELSYARRDAASVATLLTELGRTPADHIERLEDPSLGRVQDAIEGLRGKLTAHAAAGERAQLIFYYSGHARASSLSLGSEELPLSSLRASLTSLPSTLTVVVLDACQSGAISGVKGAAPAADFSVQSVQDLHSSGIAVMASSTGSELSQESSDLGASYFTHHLLVSLRGAGDRDRNGRVSLDEAYAYAYQHTLSDTARTQVGSQHATLETALTGRGDVPLSYPVDADAQLALSGNIAGKVMVQQKGGGAVMAELVKAEGAPLLIALPSGQYEVLVREEKIAHSCEVALTRGTVASLVLAQCKEVQLPEELAKSEDARRKAMALALESWFVELGMGVLLPNESAYTKRLHEFDYFDTQRVDYVFDGAAGWMVDRYLGGVLRYGVIDHQYQFARGPNGGNAMAWATHALTVGPRGRLPLLGRRLVLFGDASLGLGITSSRLTYEGTSQFGQTNYTADDKHYGLALRAIAGVNVGLTEHLGLYGAAGYAWANTLENDLGDKHNRGGWNFLFGLRLNAVTGGW